MRLKIKILTIAIIIAIIAIIIAGATQITPTKTSPATTTPNPKTVTTPNITIHYNYTTVNQFSWVTPTTGNTLLEVNITMQNNGYKNIEPALLLESMAVTTDNVQYSWD